MTVNEFVAALADLQMPDVFNPYADRCADCDLTDAPKRRRANLKAFLSAAIDSSVDTIWIARDLGYRGGRRTGVPLTDEVHLTEMARLFGGLPLSRATVGPPLAERTAALVWHVIGQINRPVFLWNVFPLHPHEPDDPMSNRCHTRAEREACRPLLVAILNMLNPRQIVAIGRDAHSALVDLGIDAATVRHPSYGGQSDFTAGLFKLYGVEPKLPGAQAYSLF